MPFFCWVSKNVARNHVVSAGLVEQTMLPAAGEV
jgi:hypothetical protein